MGRHAVPKTVLRGDASSRHLSVPAKSDKRVCVIRDPEKCFDSLVRRYPMCPDKVGLVLEEFLRLHEAVLDLREDGGGDHTLFIDYPEGERFSEDTIGEVFLHCTGRHINRDRLTLLGCVEINKFG
jgi:hypothetical protein